MGNNGNRVSKFEVALNSIQQRMKTKLVTEPASNNGVWRVSSGGVNDQGSKMNSDEESKRRRRRREEKDEIQTPNPNFLTTQTNMNDFTIPSRGMADELPRPPVINRPPEKRQRVPSAYNRFIKDEIQRIKAGNPDITHREAFSAAAKNWAHFPHIHFGLMPDQPVKKTNVRQQEGEDVLMKDGFFSSANVGVSPY